MGYIQEFRRGHIIHGRSRVDKGDLLEFETESINLRTF